MYMYVRDVYMFHAMFLAVHKVGAYWHAMCRLEIV